MTTSRAAADRASTDFAQQLLLQKIDRDIFTGVANGGGTMRAYGGQVAAQSLMAAGMTIDEPDRHVHSLHGYFLRPGRSEDQITYLVERPRDGGSFSSRIVRAIQNGETIFMMTASFSVEDSGPEHQFTQPLAPPPEDDRWLTMKDTEVDELGLGKILEKRRRWLDLRIPHPDTTLPLIDGRYECSAWLRVLKKLPDDSLIQACALTFLSDLTMLTTALSPNSQMRSQLQMASIDHAVWFHAPIQADQWLLFAQDTPVARGGHGLARGLFYNADGVLIASVVQESLIRRQRQK